MTTFNKIYNQTVLEDIEFIIDEEFNIPIRYDNNFSGNSFFQIIPQGENLIERRSNGDIREYSILITYFEKSYGNYTKKDGLDNRVRVVERLKKLIRNNIDGVDDDIFFLTVNGKFFITSEGQPLVPAGETDLDWHNARVESIEYSEDADNNRYLTGTVDFRCVVEEVHA